MNRSYSKIKHIKEANIRLEQRLLTEVASAQFQAQAQKASGCFSETNTPKLWKLAKGMGLGALAIGAFALTYFSAGAADGISGGLSFTSGLLLSASSMNSLYESIKNDGGYIEELKKLYHCAIG